MSTSFYFTRVHKIVVLDERHCNPDRCEFFIWGSGSVAPCRCWAFPPRRPSDPDRALRAVRGHDDLYFLRSKQCRKEARSKP